MINQLPTNQIYLQPTDSYRRVPYMMFLLIRIDKPLNEKLETESKVKL